MRTVDNPLCSRLFLSEMDISAFKKTLVDKLAKDLFYTFITPNELDIKVHSLINAINIAMTLAISKARLSLKLVPGFDEECKKIQMKARKLKKIWKKRKNRKKLGRLPNCLSKKKMSDSKSQKENVLQVKGRSICFFQEYVKSHKTCLK